MQSHPSASSLRDRALFARTIFVLFTSTLLAGIIAAAFWFQDWQYLLPTPRPAGLVQPQMGSLVSLPLPADDALPMDHGKPLFLHFFNPDCPCSRFNLDHVRDLVKIYGPRVRFVAVMETAHTSVGTSNYGLPMRAVTDHGGSIARRYGVYSTPQAVLLTADGRLCYRGNYNVSRYCTEHSTEFARLALDALLKSSTPPPTPRDAVIAYGCPLPSAPASRTGNRLTGFSRFCARRVSLQENSASVGGTP